MDLKEKLRLAAQQAENEQLSLIPPDSEIDWIPSETFNEKMNELIGIEPKRRVFTIRRLSILAAAVALITVFCIPVFMNSSETTDGGIHHENNLETNGDHTPSENHVELEMSDTNHLHESDISNNNSSNNSSLGNSDLDMSGDYKDETIGGGDDESVPCDDKYDGPDSEESLPAVESPIPFFYEPAYLPEGYAHIDSAITQYFVVRTYSNGEDIVRLYYINGEADFSIFVGTRNDYNNLDYYSNVPMMAHFILDESTHELKEYIFFPDGVEWNRNNVAWNNSGMTFAIMGNENISQEEIEKIAISVNIEPKE